MDVTIGPVVIVKAPAELDVYTVPRFREHLIKADLTGTPLVIADLTATTYIDNPGLGALIGALRRARQRDAQFGVVCTHPYVLKVFRITGLTKAFDIRDSADEFGAAADNRPTDGGN